MNNIPGVSYPINSAVRKQLRRRANLARLFQLPEADRSGLEIVRILDNTHYNGCDQLLDYLDDSTPIAEWLVEETRKETDMMQFEAKLAELYLLRHIADRMPGRVIQPDGSQADTKPEMIVKSDDLVVAIEVYSPIDLFGFQLVKSYVTRILKYLEIDRGYDLRVKIEPDAECDPFYAYQFEAEQEIRPWLSQFAEAAAAWLSNSSPQQVFEKKGPNVSGWRVTVEIEELHEDRDCRCISQNTAGQSTDARLYFETCSLSQTSEPHELLRHRETCPKYCAEITVNSWWGRSVRRKMEKRQAGSEPRDGLLRLLVIDFSRLDTSFPDFICWPNIATRIDESVQQIAKKITEKNDVQPYDMVLPAFLGTACGYGSPIWLKSPTDIDMDFIDRAGLAVPSKKPEDITDWSSLFSK